MEDSEVYTPLVRFITLSEGYTKIQKHFKLLLYNQNVFN